MLKSSGLARHEDVAVRYLPVTGSLNVCGDWYHMVDLVRLLMYTRLRGLSRLIEPGRRLGRMERR
ncbi:hypothetical protein [Streptomyces sp. NPDC048527]|uniref:hypothetical protein n=1 Tax=Streptomyces sp. NPDC048527 TaxID=3365568 RepID=UPI00370F9AF6